MDPIELVDRYVAEIGKDLPRKTRLDIEAEILTAIEDMLAERCRKTGKAVDEEMIVEVLKEYGAPHQVAASYQPERYVIGPKLYPSFLTVVQVVLPILAALALVKLGVSLGQSGTGFEDIFEAIFLGIAGFIGSAFTALGAMLVLFAVVERTLPEFKEKAGEWDPRRLPAINSRNRLDTAGLLMEIFGAGLAIILFNFFPQTVNLGYYPDGSWWVGILSTTSGEAWSATILSAAFFGSLPALTILWSLIILLDIGLLYRGRWEAWSRWAVLVLKVATIALAAVLLAGPALVDVSVETLLNAGFPDPLAARLLIKLAEQGATLALVMTIVGSLVTVVRLLLRLTGRNLTPRLEKFAHP
jgi:hypothetical protein